ncbi:hypothetical protein AUC43_17980 [Hymenobacter sedentarius]|uniref:Uncharacterized protein n=1 Tax=Hymenobacter sedentarius TaxID=1411621 RepID=A0A0U3SKX9_9BACT|nr:hypothetical protein AUC43_17980 [Hymenobacter sedentarius]
MVGLAHLQTQSLGLVGARNQAAVVVREHHHGLDFLVRRKNPLAGNIKIMAIDEGVHTGVVILLTGAALLTGYFPFVGLLLS